MLYTYQELNKAIVRFDRDYTRLKVDLDDALLVVGRLRGQPLGRALLFGECLSEIGSSKFICVRIGWSGGGGHFVTIVGAEDGPQQFLTGRDPLPANADHTLPYQEFAQNYEGTGTWTDTYFTA